MSDLVAAIRRLLHVIAFGAVFMILFGSALHFFYGWFGQSTVVGLLAPVNESIWEHAKLVFLPPLLWYCFVAVSIGRDRSYELASASAAALWFMPLFQIAFYYAYAAVAHGDLFVMDIVDFTLTVVLGQVLFYRLTTRLHFSMVARVAAVISIVGLAAVFVVFTLRPPHIPLFMDPTNGTYGLPMK
ncbi:MAG: DUF6512 family protein [Candidatus Cryosericum sp.]